jgi:hypothetical protein
MDRSFRVSPVFMGVARGFRIYHRGHRGHRAGEEFKRQRNGEEERSRTLNPE